MRTALLFTLSIAFAFLVSVEFATADDELAKLGGKWTVESFEFNGQPVDEMLAAVREFKADQYSLTPKNGQTFSGTFKIDAAQTPKQIDLMLPDRTLRGIFEIDGTTLRLAYALEGDARPTTFESKPDSGIVLVMHKKSE
jgi:uncharacterized protein (TIGR03067 family)